MARPVIDAIRSGDVNLAKKLLLSKKYSCLDSQTSQCNGTALFFASCRGLLDIVELLLLHGASVSVKTSYGSTPLHAAADANHPLVISLLLKHGAEINTSTVNGDTPCHLAAYRGHKQVVQMLVEAGADIQLRNRKCHRPVDEAECNGHSKIVEYLTAVADMFQRPTPSTTELDVCCSLPHQRVPLRDCNSTSLYSKDSMDTPRYHFYHNPAQSSPSEGVCLPQYVSVNDLSVNTHSIASNTQLNYFNIPLYE